MSPPARAYDAGLGVHCKSASEAKIYGRFSWVRSDDTQGAPDSQRAGCEATSSIHKLRLVLGTTDEEGLAGGKTPQHIGGDARDMAAVAVVRQAAGPGDRAGAEDP